VRRAPLVVAAAILIWVVTLLATPGAQAAPSVTFKCTPAPQNCTGWYGSNVTITWDVIPSDATKTGCVNQTLTTDTTGTDVFCRATDTQDQSTTVELKLKVDKTPPVVTGGQPARDADTSGWYNHAVPIVFSGSDLTSGIASCTSTTYGGPDTSTANVQGKCVDRAGNESAALGYGVRYDETPPTVTAARTDRPPDHGAWFTAPVRLAVEATDATSGLAECPTLTYGGPDSGAVSVIGTCRDRAGNVASRTFALSFDATPPILTVLSAAGGDRRVMLRWKATGGPTAVEIVRSPGIAGAPTSVVFRGAGDGFVDSQVANGSRYAYEVRVLDAAGNVGSRTLRAVPGPRLIAPSAGAMVKAREPPVLRWTPVRNASYYNVQLYRDGRKVLTAWPTRARLRLKRTWTYNGDRTRFTKGEYRWLVWPGRGSRSKADYGERIGVRKFTVP